MNRVKRRSGQDIQLASVNDLFGLNEPSHAESLTTVVFLSTDDLCDFHHHPFKVIPDDTAMMEMIESIRDNGILVPLEVRSKEFDKYEIIAGHRRKYAAEQAGLKVVPCILSNADNDTAVLRMVDSNLYRPDILPSEKAFAYKMKLDAMKRQAGRQAKDNASQVGTQKRSDSQLADQVGESRNQIQRYIRLTCLYSPLLELVDAKKIPLNVGVAVSYLDEMRQIWLFELLCQLNVSISLSQAEKMKKYHADHKLTKEVIEVILSEETGSGPSISLKTKEIEKYFPPKTSKQEMEQTIFKLLENWMNRRA